MNDTEAINAIIEIMWPTGDEAVEWSADEIEYVAEIIREARPADYKRKQDIAQAIIYGIEV